MSDLDHKQLKQTLDAALAQSGISIRQNRLLALAAVFQASELTYLLATQGKGCLQGVVGEAYDQLLKASFDIHPKQLNSYYTLHFFQHLDQLHLGLRVLEGALMQPYQPNKPRIPNPAPYSEALRYAMALLHIERKVYRQSAYVEKIAQHQLSLKHRLNFFEHNLQHPAILASTASLYVETAGTLHSRLSVRGKPQYLTDQANIDRIRACLFTGIQAAHLWRQLGGSRWQAIFGRRKILEDIQQIASIHRQLTEKPIFLP